MIKKEKTLCLANTLFHNNSLKSCESVFSKAARALLRVVQEQHDWVELFLWPIISPQRHDEVVQSVAGRLSRHNYELVLKAVCFGIFKAVMLTTL